jgi:hypothetical protein
VAFGRARCLACFEHVGEYEMVKPLDERMWSCDNVRVVSTRDFAMNLSGGSLRWVMRNVMRVTVDECGVPVRLIPIGEDVRVGFRRVVGKCTGERGIFGAYRP